MRGARARRDDDVAQLLGGRRAAAVLGLAEAALTVAVALLLAHAIALGVAGVPDPGAVAPTLAALASVILARAATGAAAELAGARAGRRAVARLRAATVDAALASAGSGDTRPGALAATAVHGADAVGRYAGRYRPARIVGTVGPLLALGAVAVVDPLSAGLLAVALPIGIVFLALVGLRAQAATDERHAGLLLLQGHLLDVLRGLPVLRAHGRARFQVDQVRAAGEAYRSGTVAVLREAFLSSFVLELVAMLGTALVAVACGLRLAQGAMDFGPAIAALVLAPEVFGPLRRLGAEYHAAADAEPVLRELATAAARPATVPTGRGVQELRDPGVHDLALRAVTCATDDRARPALERVDLRIGAGRTTALVGPSGSGKTTLLRLLAGLRSPDAGSVRCGGRPIDAGDLAAWRDGIAWVPQRPTLLPGTLRDNLQPPASRSDRSLTGALRTAGLGPLLAALPAGLDTPMGEGGLPLSAGELRRLAVARALLREPRLVLVDEPTANLDPDAAASVVAALDRLVTGRTAVIASHDPAPLRLAHDVVVLEAGRVVQQRPARPAPPAPVPADPPVHVPTLPATATAAPAIRTAWTAGPDRSALRGSAGRAVVALVPDPDPKDPR
ncbi:thiol reductant ABC exporter subunit CydD [Patulibacter brassicae]|uniref:Thiol reductant ABC exporter subunit CydD n=1 Tax=Patulibacter brassicae TaxID=1705717 RepID=A0ABU4VKN4_9ACTN|nr:thiol reductant ABC exporter subunit CydD [Patulibacter brassicae]MDX8152397.1 thiol reductant ABC exporter subunit CydD [Patulibacter brassicae]